MANVVANNGSLGEQQNSANSVEQHQSSSDNLKQTNKSNPTTTNEIEVVYDVEHLATFSTTSYGSCHEQQAARGKNGIDRSTSAANGDFKLCRDSNNKSDSNSSNGATGNTQLTTTPRAALERLFELEKLSGIWTQRMQIELRDDLMLILDCETNSIVERFNRNCVTKPEAFEQYNDIYNNIVVFIIKQLDEHEVRGSKQTSDDSDREEREGEIHIFKCVSHQAQQLVEDITYWKTNTNRAMNGKESKSVAANAAAARMAGDETAAGNSKSPAANLNNNGQQASNSNKPIVTVASCNKAAACDNVPIVNVNVKETVQVFNQIAALREKGKSTSPTNHHQNARQSSVDSSAATNTSHQQQHQLNGASASAKELDSGNKLANANGTGQQLYKQRSIRATLAPKYASDSPQQTNRGAGCGGSSSSGNNNGSSNGSSSVSSSFEAAKPAATAATSSSAPSQTNNNQAPASSAKHTANNINHRDSEHANKITNNGQHHSSSSSSSRQQPSRSASSPQQQQQHQQAHSGKSPKSSRQQQKSHSDSSRSHVSSTSQIDQVTTNESYVSVLNHCFDDIEKFIIRLQQAVAAIRELQSKQQLPKKSSKRNSHHAGSDKLVSSSSGSPPLSNVELSMLNAKARGPSDDDYFEILSKFKLAFNLLAKLKGCIHEPNAPELVHFLFTPLAIIIESARNAMPPIDPTLVGIPYLNQEALDLLSNCCTSKESDLWVSLGPNWTQTIDLNILKASRLPSSFQPIFSDGWAPIIGELELIGLVAPPSLLAESYNDEASSNHHHCSKTLSSNGGAVNRNYPLPLPPKQSSYAVAGNAISAPVGRSPTKQHLSASNGKKRTSNTPAIVDPTTVAPPYTVKQSMPYYVDEQNTSEPPINNANGYRLSSQPNRRFSSQEYQSHHGGLKSASSGRYPAEYPQMMEPSALVGHYQQANIHHLPSNVDGNDSQFNIDLQQHGDNIIRHHQHHSDDYTELHNQHYSSEQNNLPHHRVVDKGNHRHHHHRLSKQSLAAHNMVPYVHHNQPMIANYETEYFNEIEHEAMLLDLGPSQTEWFYELQSRGALIVRVLFSREANNDKELSVGRGEILEILDDTRKWWKARNIDMQVAYVPHTIVAVTHGYQTLDELLANNPNDLLQDDSTLMMNANHRGYSRQEHQQQPWPHDDKRNSKAAGAFRYF